jgi:hypothetical protein
MRLDELLEEMALKANRALRATVIIPTRSGDVARQAAAYRHDETPRARPR